MTTNVKIRTEDVFEILDTKIKTSAAHAQLDVVQGEFYDSVLSKIAARSPTFDEKAALENAYLPSAVNPYITLSTLTDRFTGAMPWKTIGTTGSGADFEGDDEAPFIAAFATGETWFYVKPGVYVFSTTLTVPEEVKVVGSITTSTILISDAPVVLNVSNFTYLGFLSVIATADGATAINAASANALDPRVGVYLHNCLVASASTGKTIDVTNSDSLTLSESALLIGNLEGSNFNNSIFENIYIDASGVEGINLDAPNNLIMWGSTVFSGVPTINSGVNVRFVGNHFNSGIAVTGDVLLRANTPASDNNEDETLLPLLQYLGSLSSLQTNPAYSSNFAGPQGQDVTARASALDLLLQWRYEERNFSLVAQGEPMTVTWTPSSNTLTTGGMKLVSGHRSPNVWLFNALNTVIPDGSFLYFILNRDISANTILTPYVALMGTFPDLITEPPTGDPTNRQIWVLAFNSGGTLWWRGGRGSRFPNTGYGEYFVDGSSKSLLTYLGANDYNDSDPAYSNNFAGVQSESLTTRLGKTDTLLKRLFEFSNLGYYLSTGGYLYTESNTLYLTGTLYFTIPNTGRKVSVAASSWTIPDGSLLYFSWDQSALYSSNQVATGTVATTVPMPDNNQTIKYFVAAFRVGSEIILWTGTKLPLAGGRYPVPTGRSVIRTASPSTLIDNFTWSGTNFLWEKLAVACSTGIALARNSLTDQTSINASLTTIADGEGLVITHTWNTGAGGAQSVTIEKKALPLTTALAQNQFLWVYNRGGYLYFMEDI